MKQGLLHGGFSSTPENFEEFLEEFLSMVTPAEWQILALLPECRHFTELVSIVCEIRSTPYYPLPPQHPLNPAERFAVAS